MMFNSIRKDKNRRNLVKKFEIQRLQNKVLLQDLLLNKGLIRFFDKNVSSTDKKFGVEKKSNMDLYSFWQKKTLKFIPRNSSRDRVKNRCIASGRSRAVLRFCKLSRIYLRDKASKGLVPGVTKASW